MELNRIVLTALLFTPMAFAQDTPTIVEPIIDMHLHAMAADEYGPPPVAMCSPFRKPAWDPAGKPYGALFGESLAKPQCSDPELSPVTDEAVMADTIAAMERLNITGVLSGPPDRVARWRKAAPDRFIAGREFRIGRDTATPAQLRAAHAADGFAVLAEVSNQLAGIAPDDARMEPYWALMEELDIPVGIHIGTGPPGVSYLGGPKLALARLHSALTLEPVLQKHPNLRVYVMHAGYPMLDDMLALLYEHPQVYVDTGVIIYTESRPAFYRYLQALVDGGFGDRILFGSDQMIWPGMIGRAVATINDAPFLSQSQKRDILYNNAARFLQLSEQQRAGHREMSKATR